MSPPRTLLVALALAASGCAGGSHAARGKTLPPPAPDRAGARDPGAGPDTGSRQTAAGAAKPARDRRARALPHDLAVRRALDAASGLVGARDIVISGIAYGDGCAALVRAALDAAGVPSPPDAAAAALLADARARGALRRGRPAAGDVVFLAERPGGPAEHVGLVQSVGDGGTALVLHRTERGVRRLRLTGAQPWKARGESGRILNDVLVVGAGRVTAGRLLVGYATFL
jgi:cell wall-associated NlpC family hydrolase